MMEELQTIFAVGAGAVTKLVKHSETDPTDTKIKRIFRPKYPYEYLRLAEEKKSEGETSLLRDEQEIFDFFAEKD